MSTFIAIAVASPYLLDITIPPIWVPCPFSSVSGEGLSTVSIPPFAHPPNSGCVPLINGERERVRVALEYINYEL